MKTTLLVKNFCKSNKAIDSDSALSLHDKIKEQLEKDIDVILNFDGISFTVSSFLNNAIGLLYNDFDSAKLSKHITVVNMSQSDKAILNRVLENARSYYENRKFFDKLTEDEHD